MAVFQVGFFGPINFGKELITPAPQGQTGPSRGGFIRGGRIHTFYQLDRDYKGRYGSHMVHLRKPLLEWAGNDLIRISIRIKLNAAWCGDPLPVLDRWHYFHENALAAPLVIGGKPMADGNSLFVIAEMKEIQKNWLPNGQLIAVELDVHFEEYIASMDIGSNVSLTSGIPGFPQQLALVPHGPIFP
jgi:hypothetical protein